MSNSTNDACWWEPMALRLAIALCAVPALLGFAAAWSGCAATSTDVKVAELLPEPEPLPADPCAPGVETPRELLYLRDRARSRGVGLHGSLTALAARQLDELPHIALDDPREAHRSVIRSAAMSWERPPRHPLLASDHTDGSAASLTDTRSDYLTLAEFNYLAGARHRTSHATRGQQRPAALLAEALLLMGRYAEGRALLLDAYAACPADPVIMWLIGVTEGDAALIEQAARGAGWWGAPALDLGDLHLRRHQLDEADRWYQLAERHLPQATQHLAQARRAVVALRRGDTHRARVGFEAVLADDTCQRLAWEGMFVVHYKEGRSSDACFALERAELCGSYQAHRVLANRAVPECAPNLPGVATVTEPAHVR